MSNVETPFLFSFPSIPQGHTGSLRNWLFPTCCLFDLGSVIFGMNLPIYRWMRCPREASQTSNILSMEFILTYTLFRPKGSKMCVCVGLLALFMSWGMVKQGAISSPPVTWRENHRTHRGPCQPTLGVFSCFWDPTFHLVLIINGCTHVYLPLYHHPHDSGLNTDLLGCLLWGEELKQSLLISQKVGQIFRICYRVI